MQQNAWLVRVAAQSCGLVGRAVSSKGKGQRLSSH